MKPILDGVVDPKLWGDSKTKVLFVLKEPGAAGDDYDSLQELFIRKWGRQAKYSFINLGRWAHSLQSDPRPDFSEANDKTRRDLAFMSSAVVNLRKIPSDIPDKSCNEKRLLEESQGIHEAGIKDQIKSIGPDVIVCCGYSVYAIVLKILGPEKKNYRLFETCHPSARYTALEKYDSLTLR